MLEGNDATSCAGLQVDGPAAGVVFTGATITGNVASLDGGGGCVESEEDVEFVDSIITKNEAGNRGGGLSVLSVQDTSSSEVTLTRTTVEDNAAARGGGLHIFNAQVITKETTVRSNVADEGAGASLASFVYSSTDFQCDASTCLP